jgi:undecaprenyl-diphosphatase
MKLRGTVWKTFTMVRDLLEKVESRVLLAALAVVLGGMAFAEIADEVREDETAALDLQVLQALRQPDQPTQPVGPKWLTQVFDDITALGGMAVLALVTITVCLFLVLTGRGWNALLVFFTVASGVALSVLLKALFNRPRPPAELHLVHTQTLSFPSGHAMMSAIVYLSLGVLVAHLVPRRSQKVFAVAVAALIAGLVGFSRVWLGVHYLTDVLAGWAAGLVWALLCHLVAWGIESIHNRRSAS